MSKQNKMFGGFSVRNDGAKDGRFWDGYSGIFFVLAAVTMPGREDS